MRCLGIGKELPINRKILISRTSQLETFRFQGGYVLWDGHLERQLMTTADVHVNDRKPFAS